MMGSGGVGKSAITVRFVHSMFVEKYDPTIEDSYRKMMTVDGMTCSVEILDTAGTEQFMALHSIYMKQGDGFVLVFSLTSLESLSELQQIREQIHRHKEADYGGRQPPRVPLLLVGNKCDLTTERQVPREAAITVSRAWGGVPYYETSARKEINISQLFEDILRQMIKAGAGEQRAGEKKKKARRYPFPLFTAADALAQTAEPVKKPGAKRGRKQDDSLPPSRSREIQRAFRARKVEQLASLQARVKKLEEENAILRQRLGDPPRENTPEPASSTSSSKVATPKKEAEASTPDSSRAGTVGPDEEKDAPWHPDPSAPGDPYAGLFDPAGVQWPAQQTIPLPQQHLLSPGMGFPPPHNALPPPSSTPFAQLPHLAQLPPMHPAAYPPPPAAFPPSTASNAYWAAFSRLRNPSAPAPADERLFLATSCAVPFTELEHPQPYHHFCLTLLRNLPITGKGRTGRLSHPLSHSGASTPTQDECCAGLLPCPPYEDSPPTAPLSAGYIPALAAWNLISAIPGLSPIDLAGLLIEATKTAGEAGRIRCEVGHGLVIPESGIDGAVKLVEEARKLDRILGAMGPGAGGQGHPHQRQVVEEAYDPQFSFVDVGAANQQS